METPSEICESYRNVLKMTFLGSTQARWVRIRNRKKGSTSMFWIRFPKFVELFQKVWDANCFEGLISCSSIPAPFLWTTFISCILKWGMPSKSSYFMMFYCRRWWITGSSSGFIPKCLATSYLCQPMVVSLESGPIIITFVYDALQAGHLCSQTCLKRWK